MNILNTLRMDPPLEISSPQPMNMSFPPLNHYDYPVLDVSCTCSICVEWRYRQQQLQEREAALVEGHGIGCQCGIYNRPAKLGGRRRAIAPCTRLAAKMEARSTYLAANNRRDLYCESSWHAMQIAEPNSAFPRAFSAYGSGLGVKFMHWLRRQMGQEDDGWWETVAPGISLSVWFDRFALTAATASGIGSAADIKLPFR